MFLAGRDELEGNLGQRSHVCELPVLVARRRKAQLREALHGRLADAVDTRTAIRRQSLLEIDKVRQVDVLFFLHVNHDEIVPSRDYTSWACRTVSSIQPYPLASSSSASSLPPDLTIRPL